MSQLTKLKIDECEFQSACLTDNAIEPSDKMTGFLDKHTGKILWCDEEGKALLDDGGVDPISMRDRSYSHIEIDCELCSVGVLREFIESNWTDDEDLREQARLEYVKCCGRYGPWKNYAPKKAVVAFYAYDEQQKREQMEAWLREHNIEVEWS